MSTLIEEQAAAAEWAAKVKAKRDARPWARYRLKKVAANGQPTGRHEQKDRDGVVRSYPAGSVIESQEDLAERHPEKFEIIREEIPLSPEQVLVPAGYKLVKVGDAPLPNVMNGGTIPPPAPPKQPLHTKESLGQLDLPSLLLLAADEEVAVRGFEKDKGRVIAAILGK